MALLCDDASRLTLLTVLPKAPPLPVGARPKPGVRGEPGTAPGVVLPPGKVPGVVAPPPPVVGEAGGVRVVGVPPVGGVVVGVVPPALLHRV